jgi:hypothetical protein
VTISSKKYLTANAKDLQSEAARFHEFARDEPQEDDWIRPEYQPTGRRITIERRRRSRIAQRGQRR